MFDWFINIQVSCLLDALKILTNHVNSVSVGLTYFTIDWGFIWVVFSYGFLSSLGVGMAYVAPLAAGMKWFPKQKGLVNGIIVAGYGLGALVFNYVQTAYLNPLNLSPNPDGYFYAESILSRVPNLFILLFAIYITVQLIGCCLVFTPPRQPNEIIFEEGRFLLISSPDDESTFEAPLADNNSSGLNPNGGYSSCEDQDGNTIMRQPLQQMDLTYKQAIRTREFLLVCYFFLILYG